MISVRQAVDILFAEQNKNKRLASVAEPGSKEQIKALKYAEAFGLAIYTMNFMVPKTPVLDLQINSYKCSICGCIVGFEVKPGVRCYACPECMNRVNWVGID